MEKWDLLVYIPSFSLVEKYSDSLQFCITQSYNFKKNCTRNCHNEHYFMYIVIHICSYFEVLFYVALLCNEIYYSIIYKQWKFFWITLHTCMATCVSTECLYFSTRLCRIITAFSLSNVFVKHMASHFFLDTISCGGLVTSLGAKLVLPVYAYVWRIIFLFTCISMIIFIQRYSSDIWSKQVRKYHNFILSSDSN